MSEKNLTGYPSIDKPWLKYYSEEAINAELPECTVYEYLYESNKDYKNNTALNYFDRKITYTQLFENIENVSKSFSAIGVKKGDILILATVTLPETAYVFYALNRLGAIANFVDPRTSEEGIREYIKEVDAKVVLTISAAYPKIIEAVKGTNVEKIIVQSPADSLPAVKKVAYKLANKEPDMSEKSLKWSDFINLNSEPEYAPYEKDACCVIVHTGGTTGSPKGVMLSNDNLNAATYQAFISPLPLLRGDIFLNIMPPFIAYGLVLGLHTAISMGWQSILIPSFNPNEFADLLLKYKPNGIMGVPTYYESLLSEPKMNNSNLSHIKVALVGGDKTDGNFENRINSFLADHKCKIHLSKGYSMTEASSTATISFESANAVGSNGIPLSMTTIAAFDPDTHKELKYEEQGELYINTPTIMLGYYENEIASLNIKVKKDGITWLHTGDIGYVDKNGLIYVVGRIKRMIIRHDGFKIFPSHVENVISKNKLVDACCAIGVRDTVHTQGKVPVVYAVLNDTSNESEVKAELKKLCEKKLPEYAQPIDFIFIDKLPLTPIGKVDYRTLEKMAEEKGE